MTTLPDWNGPPEKLAQWTNEMLDAMAAHDDNDERDYSLLRHVHPIEDDASAIKQAQRGNIGPLHARYPRLKQFLFPPKLKKGQRFPPNPFIAYATSLAARMAIDDVWRIRRIWTYYFKKKNRPLGDKCTAEGIAAKRNGISVEVLLNAIKNRK